MYPQWWWKFSCLIWCCSGHAPQTPCGLQSWWVMESQQLWEANTGEKNGHQRSASPSWQQGSASLQKQLGNYFSDRHVEIMEEEPHWKPILKIYSWPWNMIVPCMLSSEVWMEPSHSTVKTKKSLWQTACKSKPEAILRMVQGHKQQWILVASRTQLLSLSQKCRLGFSVVLHRGILNLGCWGQDKLRPNPPHPVVQLLSESLWKVTLSYKLTSHTSTLPFSSCIMDIFFLLGNRF